MCIAAEYRSTCQDDAADDAAHACTAGVDGQLLAFLRLAEPQDGGRGDDAYDDAPSQNITALEPASRLPTTAARSTMGTSGSVGSK